MVIIALGLYIYVASYLYYHNIVGCPAWEQKEVQPRVKPFAVLTF